MRHQCHLYWRVLDWALNVQIIDLLNVGTKIGTNVLANIGTLYYADQVGFIEGRQGYV